MRHRVVVGFGIAWLAFGLLACAQGLVQVRESPSGSSEPITFSRVAIVPFRAVPRPGAAALRADASPLLASYVAEAFAARGVDVVPASDVAQALGETSTDVALRTVADLARERFGADAVATGSVHRFREREGEAMGSLNPASVGFEVRVYSTAEGKLLWSGSFDHTQVALGDNALTAARYPGGGTRWMTVEELSRWGAGQVVQSMPLAVR